MLTLIFILFFKKSHITLPLNLLLLYFKYYKSTSKNMLFLLYFELQYKYAIRYNITLITNTQYIKNVLVKSKIELLLE